MTAATVIKCFCSLFSIFGMPSYVHSDRGSNFMSHELKEFLHSKGIATSRTTPFNPKGNGQVERLNGTLWKTVTLALKTKALPISQWESVLLDSLHSVRSLLCTATNETPHERLFQYNRKSTTGTTLPSWLSSPGPVLMKRNVRASKYEPLVDEVELIDCNPLYAHVRLQDGRETTVSLQQLAPLPRNDIDRPNKESMSSPMNTQSNNLPRLSPGLLTPTLEIPHTPDNTTPLEGASQEPLDTETNFVESEGRNDCLQETLAQDKSLNSKPHRTSTYFRTRPYNLLNREV